MFTLTGLVRVTVPIDAFTVRFLSPTPALAVPVGVPTITQPSATFPTKPFKPFTRIVSVMFAPTLVAIVAAFAVTEKSFTESVTLVERVRLLSAALTPEMATVALAAGVVPKAVERVTMDWLPGVTFGVTVAGTGVQVTPAGNTLEQPTAMSCV